MIYVIFATLTVAMILIYHFSDYDFFSPAMVYIESFWLATLMATLLYQDWGVRYHFDFFILLIMALLIFFVGCQISKSQKKRIVILKKICKLNKNVKADIIDVPYFVYFFSLLISLLALYVYYREISKISYSLGNRMGLAGSFYLYHNKVVLSNDSELRISPFSSMLNRVNLAFAYYFSYVFCNNVVRRKDKIRNNIRYLLFPIIYMLSTFIGSQRTGIIYILFANLFMGFIMERQRKKWKKGKKSTLKIVRYSFIAVIVIAFLLKEMGDLMGRTNNQTTFAYFAGYLGGGIPNFSRFTDSYHINVLSASKDFDKANSFWPYLGVRCNLSTWLSGYAEMGVVWFLLYVFVTAYLFASVYYSYIYKKEESLFSDFILIILSYAMQCILFVGLSDIVRSHIITGGFLIFAILIYLFQKFLYKKKLKKYYYSYKSILYRE